MGAEVVSKVGLHSLLKHPHVKVFKTFLEGTKLELDS